jgi:type IV pilus assembly protein PilM
MANFLGSLKSSFGKESYLGIDIGTASIKAVELGSAEGKPTLKNYGILEGFGHLERINSAIQTSSLKILDKQTAELIKRLLEKIKPDTKNVVASLPAFSAFTSLIEIPVMSKEETSQAMQYQAKTFVPLPLTDVTIDWIPVETYKDAKGIEKQRVFLVSVPNDQIEKYRSIFQTVGLSLRFLEVETLSLARILTSGDPTTSMLVDIGARSTAIGVAAGGLLRYNGQTDFASGALTQAVTKGLGINTRRAEDLKRQKGLTGTGGEYQLSTLMLPYVDVILNEVRRVRDIYEKNYKSSIERIILSGGGANLLGIGEYVSKQMGNLPTVKANPLDNFVYPPELSPFASNLGASLSVALGLGVRQFSPQST